MHTRGEASTAQRAYASPLMERAVRALTDLALAAFLCWRVTHVNEASVITELGIDSLSMMQIVGEMETELGIMIPDEDLVELITVGDLCKKVGDRLGGGEAS